MPSSRPVRVILATTVLALCCTAAALAGVRSQASVQGTWAGKYSGSYSGTFTLTWKLTNGRLHGSIALSKPSGSYGITGKVGRGGAISFGVVAVGATYTGAVHGSKMSGRYKTGDGGSGSWSAHKVSSRTTR